MTFKERAEIAIRELAKQGPVTLEEARLQAIKIKEWSKSKDKKK
jgi:hypothetical protein